MDKKKIKILENDKEILHELVDFLLKVVNPNIEDFQECIKKINKLENDTFFLSNLRDIDILSTIKRVFHIIDRDKTTYYEYKYILFTILSRLEKLYNNYIEKGIGENDNITKVLEEEILKYQEEINEIIAKRNIKKQYYYIKVELDTKVPYFYLSRRTILLNLLEYGKPYNYTPSTLDDDAYEYFILDFRINDETNVNKLFEKLKKSDNAILNYSIFKIESNNNLYNLKFYIKEEINKYSCLFLEGFKFIDIIHYSNFYDTYIESKNQRYLLEDVFKIKNKEINLITMKKISDREVKIFLPNGIKNDNIDKIKDIIKNILIDKNISEIIYTGEIDFKAYQLLEYLKKRYNIEYGRY
ncbi:hypothetical protein [Oceanivirga salmonicida]|uniref:hypothetical protein n=1 Tax=Oceanivirga salmonicida TaxID=1769291 RepID=UPI000831B134|nr:hypothetical protein [Oceanivirga salmonicida]